jgi:hypothetical protein
MSSSLSVEERLRAALNEWAATTTVDPDTWEKVGAGSPSRLSGRRRWFVAAAAAVIIVVVGVAVAVTLRRGPSDRRVVVGSGTANVTRTVAGGHVGSAHWVLKVRRDGDRLDVELRSGTARGSIRGGVPTALLDVVSARDKSDSVVYVFGIAPPGARSVRLSDALRQKSVTVAAFGDSRELGARVFVAVRNPSDPPSLRVEALGPSGSVLASEQLVATIREPTKGPVFPPQGGSVTPEMMAQLPDYIPVTGRGTIDVAGYASKCDLGFCLPLRPRFDSGASTVFAADLQTVVGHEYPGKGFVPLGTNPVDVPDFPTLTVTTSRSRPPNP